MYVFFRKIIPYLTLISCLGANNLVLAGTMGAIKKSNWFVGGLGSILWAKLPNSVGVNNGAPYPYNNDDYTLTTEVEGAAAMTLGYEWSQANQWLPVYALGLQYEHFFLNSIVGTITQYSNPQFLNYSYNWNTSADVLSIYSKINIIRYEHFSPFINLGIGWAMNHSNRISETAYPGITARISPGFSDHTQNNVAYNIGAGMDYELLAKWSVSAAYNYQSLGKMRSSNGLSTWAEDYLNIKNYQINMLRFGLTYHIE